MAYLLESSIFNKRKPQDGMWKDRLFDCFKYHRPTVISDKKWNLKKIKIV